MHIVKAEGSCFWDASGKRYLDLSAQLMCVNLGHQNQAVVEAIVQQARSLAYLAPSHTCDVRARLAVKLLEVMPKRLEKFFLTTWGPEASAAVIEEPVVGTNGVLVPPKEYLPRLAKLAKERGVLLIADEVMSGWGRTGEWFAVDNWGVVPDILTTAKGITGALAPLGLVATSREIADYFDDHYFAHGHTYEAHPLTLAPAIAAIDEYKRLDLIERSRRMGEVLGAKLQALKDKHPSVGDVRGLGLFWAVDLVKNRKTKEPFHTPKEKAAR